MTTGRTAQADSGDQEAVPVADKDRRLPRQGEKSIRSEAERRLSLYAEWEPYIRAFAFVDPDAVRSMAATRQAEPRRSEIHGWLVGVKDIIDTRGVPTERGSPLFAGRVPTRSAQLVLNLERAGAVVFGKTVTAELAAFEPGPALNPWDVTRTPGGSSMGSAAAVAAGVVRAAVGTQTNGSVIRPAAFCGVVGYKPTHGLISMDGTMDFSPTLDTIGAFASSVDDAAILAGAMSGDTPSDTCAIRPVSTAPRLGVIDVDWSRAESAMKARFELDCVRFREAGADLVPVVLPSEFDDVHRCHRVIQAVEALSSLGPAVFARPALVSEKLRNFLIWAMSLARDDYPTALSLRQTLRERFESLLGRFDALITIPATGEAPAPETTGDPRFCTPWTLVGAPAIVLPTGLGPSHLPLGLQVVGPPGSDRHTIATALWLENQTSWKRTAPDRPPQRS